MAIYRIVDVSNRGNLFTVELVSGPESPPEVRMFEGVRSILRDAEHHGKTTAAASALARLREIANQGLVVQWHRADIWLPELELFKWEFYGSGSPQYFEGKYFSAIHKPDDDGYLGMYYFIREGSPPKEYGTFISNWISIRASLVAILEGEESTERRRTQGVWRRVLTWLASRNPSL